MTRGSRRYKGRTAEALRALDEQQEFARHRVWMRIRERQAAEPQHRDRRPWVGLGAAAAAGVVVAAVFVQQTRIDSSDRLSQREVAFDAVAQMLNAQPADSDDTTEFARYLVLEAQADTP